MDHLRDRRVATFCNCQGGTLRQLQITRRTFEQISTLRRTGVIEKDLQEQIRPLHPPYSCRPFAAHALCHAAHFETTSRLLNIPELCVMVPQTQVWSKHPR
jgi:hypothetical protein